MVASRLSSPPPQWTGCPLLGAGEDFFPEDSKLGRLHKDISWWWISDGNSEDYYTMMNRWWQSETTLRPLPSATSVESRSSQEQLRRATVKVDQFCLWGMGAKKKKKKSASLLSHCKLPPCFSWNWMMVVIEKLYCSIFYWASIIVKNLFRVPEARAYVARPSPPRISRWTTIWSDWL